MRKNIFIKNQNLLFIICFLAITISKVTQAQNNKPDSIAGHKVVLDNQQKLVSWMGPPEKAFDQFLHQRWNFIKTSAPLSPSPPPRSFYPQYYFYCAFKDSADHLLPDTWMNDIGEKIPNWFESARLYYAYTGDSSVMEIVRNFVDYTMEHGTGLSTYIWPNFPYTTTNAGDTEFRGFTSAGRFALHEVQVDHAADMGLTYLRMYFFYDNPSYKEAALNIANTLVSKMRKGTSKESPWPYRVNIKTGEITSEYGANWTGAYMLFNALITSKIGNMPGYKKARKEIRRFLLKYPLQTGYWTDGHSDVNVKSNTYKSNMSKSNFNLCLFDHPEIDPDRKENIPRLIQWTEENFVIRCAPYEPSTQWGANIVGEQDDFLPKMDYQTARYAAECARWYAMSGDETYKEKAYRSLSWVTYCNDSIGKASESPLSKGISNWWSDCYGECPRMFYQVFSAIPEWAPKNENHILYSESVVKEVLYFENRISYFAGYHGGVDYIKLRFKPVEILLDGIELSSFQSRSKNYYVSKELNDGDYFVTIHREYPGKITILGKR